MRAWLLLPAGILIGAAGSWWAGQLRHEPTLAEAIAAAGTDPERARAPTPAAHTPAIGVSAVPPAVRVSAQADLAAAGQAGPSTTPSADPDGLLVPVDGIGRADLRDTFTDARSEGRVHDAIDIMAAAGTPVVAVADGHVEKLFDSQRGGLTLYQFDPSGTWCYYYAHLQRYADGIAEQQRITRGQVIGYVGSTGNADPAAPHLHFEIHRLTPERQWWTGEAVNPYPLLHTGAHPR